MSDNASDHRRFERLLDLWETGLVGEADEKWMQEHAASCTRCAELVASRGVADEKAAAGEEPPRATRHLPPAMIASWEHARAELRGLERRLVAQHLAECPACRRELAFFGHEPVLSPAHDPASAPHARSWVERLGEVAQRLTELAIREPLPVSVTRSAPTDAVEAARLRGLEAYASGDFGEARDHLLEAATHGNDAESWLYLGSALLLEGRAPDAIGALRAGLQHAASGRVADEIAWQLANALLFVGAAAESVEHLAAIADQGGPRAKEARSILDRLRDEADGR